MHANNKQRKGKAHARGIAVGNRFRVDAYFESRAQIEQIDRCAKADGRSRSQYVTAATIEKMQRDCAEKSL